MDGVIDSIKEIRKNRRASGFTLDEQPKSLKNCTLKEYQLAGLNFLINQQRNSLGGILGDEMGLGKTLQAISLSTFLIKEQKQKGPHLILCPLSTISHWSGEFNKYSPELRVQVYNGDKTAREGMRDSILGHVKRQPPSKLSDPDLPFDVLVTTYELVLADVEFLSRFKWRMLIVDEAHRLKNHDTMLFKTLRNKFEIHCSVLLTGTPLHNSVADLWSLLHFCAPHIFDLDLRQKFLMFFPQASLTKVVSSGGELTLNGRTKKNSRCSSKISKSADVEKVGEDTNESGKDLQDSNEEDEKIPESRLELLQWIVSTFMLRRKKKDVSLNLPKKSESLVYTPLSSLQKKMYEKILKKESVAITGGGSSGSTTANKGALLNMIIQLRKVCNHPYMFDGVEPEPFVLGEHLVKASGKMVVLDKLLGKLKAEGHRVLIFSQFTSMLDILQDYMHLRSYTYERLDGSVRSEERSAAISAFSATESETFVFLLSTRAGGLGLNLVAADTVIFADSDWNPQMDLQAQARAHRIGQTKEVRVFRLASEHSVEDVILQRALRKMQLSNSVVEKKATETNKDELFKIVKFGLSALLSASTTEDGADSVDIDAILKRAKDISFDEMAEAVESKGAASAASDAAAKRGEKMEIEMQGTSWEGEKEESSLLVPSKEKRKKVVESEVAKEDDAAFTALISGPPSSPILSAAPSTLRSGKTIISSPPPSTGGGASSSSKSKKKREIVFDSESDEDVSTPAKRKKSKGTPSYSSLSICIPPSPPSPLEQLPELGGVEIPQGKKPETQLQAEFSSVEDHGEEEEEMVGAEFENENENEIEYAIGDVTKPQRKEGDKNPCIIVMSADASGSWGHGGMFRAVDKLSDQPSRAYALASENDDLALGDVHLVPISGDLYVAIAIVLKRAKSGGTPLDPSPHHLRSAVQKIAYAASQIKASVHLPRLGSAEGWYATEKEIKRSIVSKGIRTVVYYYQRPGRKSSHIPPQFSASLGLDENQDAMQTEEGESREKDSRPERDSNSVPSASLTSPKSTLANASIGSAKKSKPSLTDYFYSPKKEQQGSTSDRGKSKMEKTAVEKAPPALTRGISAPPKSPPTPQDIFEGMRFNLYKIAGPGASDVTENEQSKKLKRIIVSNGGVVTMRVDDSTNVVITGLPNLDLELQGHKNLHHGLFVVSTSFIEDSREAGFVLDPSSSTYEIVVAQRESLSPEKFYSRDPSV